MHIDDTRNVCKQGNADWIEGVQSGEGFFRRAKSKPQAILGVLPRILAKQGRKESPKCAPAIQEVFPK